MPIISTPYLQQIETALGDAYAKLSKAKGDASSPDSSVYDINRAKAAIRGGSAIDTGLSPYTSEEGYTLGYITFPDEYYSQDPVANLPTLNFYIRGKNYTLGKSRVTLGVYDGQEWVGANPLGGTFAYSSDNTKVIKWFISVENKSYLDNSGNIIKKLETNITPSRVYQTAIDASPQNSDFSNPIKNSEVYIGSVAIDGAVYAVKPKMADVIYYPPVTGPDEIILDLFDGLNSATKTQDTVKYENYLKPAVDSLRTHTSRRGGANFKKYWKAANYSFSDNFRELYGKLYNEQLSINLLAATGGPAPTCSAYTANLFSPDKLEIVLDKSAGNVTCGATVYVVKDIQTTLSAINQHLTHAGHTLAVNNISNWSSSGHIAIKNEGENYKIWSIADYTKVNPTTMTLNFINGNYTGNQLPDITPVHLVDTVYVTFGKNSPEGSVLPLGSGLYWDAAYISASGVGGNLDDNVALIVRNV